MRSDTGLLFCVLRMINVNDGSIDGRKRLHKSAYLLQKFGAEGFETIRFDFGTYGPFSREISAALHEAIITGLVEEQSGSGASEDYDFRYHLTAAGDQWLLSYQSSGDRCLRRTLKFLRKLPYNALELSSTAIFIADEVPARDNNYALEAAIKRKSSFLDSEADARRVLRRVIRRDKQSPVPEVPLLIPT